MKGWGRKKGARIKRGRGRPHLRKPDFVTEHHCNAADAARSNGARVHHRRERRAGRGPTELRAARVRLAVSEGDGAVGIEQVGRVVEARRRLGRVALDERK